MRIHIFFSLGNLKTIYKDRVKYDYVELLQKYKKKTNSFGSTKQTLFSKSNDRILKFLLFFS